MLHISIELNGTLNPITIVRPPTEKVREEFFLGIQHEEMFKPFATFLIMKQGCGAFCHRNLHMNSQLACFIMIKQI